MLIRLVPTKLGAPSCAALVGPATDEVSEALLSWWEMGQCESASQGLRASAAWAVTAAASARQAGRGAFHGGFPPDRIVLVVVVRKPAGRLRRG